MSTVVQEVRVGSVQFEQQNQRSYEEYVNDGLKLRELDDQVQWKWGDLAIDFTKDCGTKVLKQYAREVGIAYRTLTRCRDVSKAYTREEREQYAMLSWTHFREAAARPDRDEYLRRAHDENWSVEKMKKMMRGEEDEIIDDGLQVPPRPEMEFCLGCRKWYIIDQGEACPSQGNCIQD